jgi:hypothetical protein
MKLLLAMAFAVVMAGSAIAQTDLGALSPSVEQRTGFYGSGSFSDVFNFSIGTEYHGFAGIVDSFSGGNAPGATHVSNLTLTLYAGSNATGPIQGSVTSANGSLIDLSGLLAQGSYSARISGLADGSLGGGYQFSVSANPEAAEWMMLLFGLVLVTFIVRRRSSLMAGSAIAG